MLTDLDAEIFPDDCEVVEIPSHDRWIYLIQKNGSSSIRLESMVKGWKILSNHDLTSLHRIDVYLRDPVDRYLSGMNTVVQNFVEENPDFDPHTCRQLIRRYSFLNRHYLPQWHWLVNLARFINDQCQIRLHRLEDLPNIIETKSRAGIVPLTADQIDQLMPLDPKLELWFLLDRILLGRCGQSLTWEEIKKIYRDHPVQPLRLVQDRMEAVQRVLC